MEWATLIIPNSVLNKLFSDCPLWGGQGTQSFPYSWCVINPTQRTCLHMWLCVSSWQSRVTKSFASFSGEFSRGPILSSSQNISAFFFFFFVFLGPHPRHMEDHRLGVESELQLPAYTTATATQDPSHVCDLQHNSRQQRLLNLLSEARDWTCNLMVSGRIGFHCAMTGTPEHKCLFRRHQNIKSSRTF